MQKTYRIFLASSAELFNDREKFETFLSRYNQQLAQQQKHVTFELYVWERESEAIFDTRKQDQYNQNLVDCDLFVLLCWTKVGMYTNEEFDTALRRFRETGKPVMFTYRKITSLPHTAPDADTQSLTNFATKLLHEVGHFTGSYDLPGELTTGFQAELEKLFANGTLTPGVRAECLYNAGNPLVPDTFVGREDELTTIRQRLRDGGRLMLINAEGGMGKTTIAARYWDEHQYHYQHTAWLFCEKGIVEEMKNLASGLEIDLRQYPDEKQQIEAIRTALNNKARTGDCLLVIDNANDPNQIRAFEQHFGGTHWHVLMTSRCSGVLQNEFPIRHLPRPVAKKLFMDLYPHESSPEFEVLLDQFLVAVGYNTLAIEIFAKNLANSYRYDRETMAHFLNRLAGQGLLLGDKSFKVKTGYLQTVHKNKPGEDANTDQIIEALYDLTQLADAERDWLIKMVLLPAVSHDAYFLGQLFGLPAGKLAEEHLEPLARKGWLSTDSATFRLSPVVQQLVLAKHKDTLWETGKPLVDRLNYLLETDGAFSKRQTFTQARPFADVGLVVANALPVNMWERGLLYHNVAVCFQGVGLLRQARSGFEQYQQLSAAYNDQENLAISYSKLGDLYQALGDLAQARSYFEKETELFEELYAANPASESLKNGLAISYSKLGGIYQALGDLAQARSYFEKRSQLGEELYAANPASVRLFNGLAISYYKLAMIQGQMEQLEEAFQYLKKAEPIWKILAEASPEMPEYSRNLSVVQRLLAQLTGGAS